MNDGKWFSQFLNFMKEILLSECGKACGLPVGLYEVLLLCHSPVVVQTCYWVSMPSKLHLQLVKCGLEIACKHSTRERGLGTGRQQSYTV